MKAIFALFSFVAKTLGVTPASQKAQSYEREISQAILDQIIEQYRHDPAVCAAGRNAVGELPRKVRSGTNVGIRTSGLLDRTPRRAEIVIVVARLDQSDADYLAGLTMAARSNGAASVVVIVTEQSEVTAQSVEEAGLARPALDASIVFWLDQTFAEAVGDPRLLANYIHVLGPAVVLIGSCALGYQAMRTYGRALMRFHRLFCVFAFDPFEDRPPALVRHLRAVSAHATIMTGSDAAAAVLDHYGVDPAGPGIKVVSPLTAELTEETWPCVARVIGQDFADGRSLATRSVVAKLLQADKTNSAGIEAEPAAARRINQRRDLDITVTIVFHRERRLAAPALASLSDMVRVARGAGLSMEVRAILDRADQPTRDIVNGSDIDLQSEEVDFGDLGLVRNHGVRRARGRFCAFLDGDDLWGAQWLLRAYTAATAENTSPHAIWHPDALYIFFEEDFDTYSTTNMPDPKALSAFRFHLASTAEGYDCREPLLSSPWSANVFAATDVYEQVPYRANEWEWQAGMEDWRWNLDTIGAGFAHRVVPDTVHIIRVKAEGSLDARQTSAGALPILT